MGRVRCRSVQVVKRAGTIAVTLGLIASGVSLVACAGSDPEALGTLPTFVRETTTTTLPPPESWLVYEIKKYDTLGKIANWCGVTSEAIIAFNKLKDPNTIPFGTKIKIPEPQPVDLEKCVGTTVTN